MEGASNFQKQLEKINSNEIRKDLFRAFYQQTQFIKEVKQLKEKRQQNKSMLIYGTNDMYMKLLKEGERLSSEENHSKKHKDSDSSDPKDAPKKKCKEYFKLDPKDRFLTTFDTVLIMVIAYSCFMSMFFTAFDYKVPEYSYFWILEVIVFCFFTIDIICSFMRLPLNDDSLEATSHAGIAKKYFKSG